jgi:DNA-entry nuclease
MKKNKILLLTLSLILILSVAGCRRNTETNTLDGNKDYIPNYSQENTKEDYQEPTEEVKSFDFSEVPEYSGKAYFVVNSNQPFFTKDEITIEAFENYSKLDKLGRCGVAYANVCKELMPTSDRESISDVKPSGWINKKYDDIEGGYIYNRCHLLGFQLTGENANKLNLITGTRYLNVTGMLPFENMIDDYIEETNNHVLYRVTPIYEGDNLVASGVLMEAYSVEDNGNGIFFNVYCYNVQPGYEIDYKTGESWVSEKITTEDPSEENKNESYVLNTNSKKFHKEDCNSVNSISEKNKKEYIGSREDLINEGYDPCGSCKP